MVDNDSITATKIAVTAADRGRQQLPWGQCQQQLQTIHAMKNIAMGQPDNDKKRQITVFKGLSLPFF
jgi:hypothetical protein